AAGTRDGTIYLARRGEPTRSARGGHSSYIEALRFLSNERLLSAGVDGKILLWDMTDLSIVARFDGHHARINGTELSDQGHQILSVGDDGRLLGWSPERNETREMFATKLPLTMLEVLATDDSAVICDAAGSVWHVQSDQRATLLRRPDGELVTLLRASRDGRLVVIGTAQGRVSVFDTTDWKVVRTLVMNGPLRRGAFAPDGARLVLATERHSVQLVSLRSASPASWQETSFDMRDVLFSPDGQLLTIVCSDGAVWVYSLATDSWTYTQDHHALAFTGHFSTDGRFLATGDSDGVVVVRDMQTLLTAMHR